MVVSPESTPGLEELTALRRVIADEKLPLTRRLREEETRLSELRGKHEEAMRLYLQALELRRQVQGDEHPSTLDAKANQLR